MAEEILNEFEADIENLTLVPSDGGRFEVEVNGDLVFSKLKLKRHAEAGEVPPLIREHIRK